MSLWHSICADFKAAAEPELGQVIVLVLPALNGSIFRTDNVKKCGFSLEVAKAPYEVLLTHTHFLHLHICLQVVRTFFWVWAFNTCRLANLPCLVLDRQVLHTHGRLIPCSEHSYSSVLSLKGFKNCCEMMYPQKLCCSLLQHSWNLFCEPKLVWEELDSPLKINKKGKK